MNIRLSDFAAQRNLIVDAKSAFGRLMGGITQSAVESEGEEEDENDENGNGSEEEDEEEETQNDEPPPRFRSEPYRYFYTKARIAAFKDTLPESIESITITYCAFAMWAAAVQFLNSKGDKMIKLKNLTLVFPNESYIPSPERLIDYEIIARKNGVNLSFEIGGFRHA
jgi:hypothetical protein